MNLTRDQLAALPVNTQIRASFDEDHPAHQPPVTVTRIDGDHGGAATGSYILAATKQWLALATWGADLELLHVPAPDEDQSIEDAALDAITEVRDAYPRVHTDAPSEAIVEALAARGLIPTARDAHAALTRVLALADIIDRHVEVEGETVEYRHAETGLWHDVSDDIREAVTGGTDG